MQRPYDRAMGKPKIRYGWGVNRPVAPEPARGDEGRPWPVPPTEELVVAGDEYVVTIEMRRDSKGAVVPTGVTVRRAVPTEKPPSRDDDDGEAYLRYRMRLRKHGHGRLLWPEDAEPLPLSATELRRIPFGAYVRAALALAEGGRPGKPSIDEAAAEAVRLVLPKGRPERGRSLDFYRGLLRAHDVLVQRGEAHPVRVIARQKGVPENTVHQWLYRAREIKRKEGSS